MRLMLLLEAFLLTVRIVAVSVLLLPLTVANAILRRVIKALKWARGDFA